MKRWRGALQRFLRARLAVFGTLILALLVVGSVLAPWLAPHDPVAINVVNRLKPPFWLVGGNPEFPLGTDAVGRDVLSRSIYGARLSLTIGLSAVAIAGTIGVTLGLIAGYYGGRLGAAIMRLAELQLAFPSILLYIAVMALWGSGVANLIVVLGITNWVTYARVVQGTVLSIREKEYVEAAHAIGNPDRSIILHHILPNTIGPLTVIASFSVGSMVMAESTLSFLGLGVPPSVPTWGGMLAEGRDYLRQAWWLPTLPGVAIMLTVLSANAVGDWLRDWLDPRTRLL